MASNKKTEKEKSKQLTSHSVLTSSEPAWALFNKINKWRRIFFLILAQPVYKMWIIQEPNTLELWNKLRFEKEKTDSIHHV